MTTGNRSSRKPVITVVIPTFNEAENIAPLLKRLDQALKAAKSKYEVIVVDDHSTDGTWEQLTNLQGVYPLSVYAKRGEKGKAASLLEGFDYVETPYAAMIDADLQYPPEAIPAMMAQLVNDGSDVIVARRSKRQLSLLRRFVSNGYRIVFGRMLWGLDYDIQSGLKVFRSKVLPRIQLHPKPWTFDLEFLVSCRNAGYQLGEYPIIFEPRINGQSNVHLLKTSAQVGFETIRLRFNPPNHFPFVPDKSGTSQGFHYKGKPYQPHNRLNSFETAMRRFSTRQSLLGILAITLLVLALVSNFHLTLITIITALTCLYAADLILNITLLCRSFFDSHELQTEDIKLHQRRRWPKYTIFCPLYKEMAVLSQFVEAMLALKYPRSKLEIQLLLEADDTETIAAARAMKLPRCFKIIVVPHSYPKTKPKACNYGLKKATGEYAVIYDAEDIPDTLQLKKAVLAFENAPEKVGCIQAKLNYYNWNQNFLTRLFTLEYSLWYELVLPGLQSLKAPIPLGGTSNHFLVHDLKKFGGWDPFNVTEDADLGIRLAKEGYTTLVLDSTTMEEANSQFGNWLRQRSRWIKGYIQTYFVHTRKLTNKQSKRDYLIFQLLIGGKVTSALINPLLWLITISYFVLRPLVGGYVQSLYTPAVFYTAIATMVVGNFLYMYVYMMAALRRQQYELVLFAVFMPLYWLMISTATLKAIYEFIIKPFHWQKTTHGLHLKANDTSADTNLHLAKQGVSND